MYAQIIEPDSDPCNEIREQQCLDYGEMDVNWPVLRDRAFMENR